MTKHPLNDAEMMGRVAEFAASGADPNGHYISLDTLLKVTAEVEGVSEETRARVIEVFNSMPKIIGNLVDSFKLGMTVGELIESMPDTEGVLRIVRETKNLDNVPIVNVRGEPVN